jgi:hypothetical protein
MSSGEIAVLSLIIAAFAVFSVTLAWASRDGSRTADKASRADKRHPATLPTNVNSGTSSIHLRDCAALTPGRAYLPCQVLAAFSG